MHLSEELVHRDSSPRNCYGTHFESRKYAVGIVRDSSEINMWQ